MKTPTFLRRADAVVHAREQGWVGFRTQHTVDDTWKPHYERGDNPAQQFAELYPEAFSHGEVDWAPGRTGDEDPLRVGVLVCKPGVTLAELDALEPLTYDHTLSRVWLQPTENSDGPGFLLEPADGHRWDVFKPKVGQGAAGQAEAAAPGDRAAPRAAAASASPRPPQQRSTGDSPTRRVWTIADAMPGATRQEVVAACVAQGINRNTAGTQYHHWSKARQAV